MGGTSCMPFICALCCQNCQCWMSDPSNTQCVQNDMRLLRQYDLALHVSRLPAHPQSTCRL